MRKQIIAKFASKCYECGEPINPGDKIFWEKDESTDESFTWHVGCDRSARESHGSTKTVPAELGAKIVRRIN